MSTELRHQLSAWLSATDIGVLELRGPGVHLCLLNEGGQISSVPPGTAPGASADALAVTAASVGVYLHHHPLHDVPLAAAGQALTAGQVIGLLRIGTLLLPVAAPRDGVMLQHRVAHGSTVGYGTVLAQCIPSSSR